MKILLALILIVGWFSPSAQLKAQTKPEVKKELKKEHFYWTCSMHPEVHADRPGNCPICHMPLIKKMMDDNSEKEMKLDTSKIEGRKSFRLTQAAFDASGARAHTVENKKVTFTIKTWGKILNPSRFAIQISEVDLPFIHSNQSVTFKSPGMNYSEYKGRITSIDSYLEPMGKTVRAEGVIFGQNTLRPESTLTATIEIEKTDVIAIPEDAILHSADTDYVFLFDPKNKVLTPTKITLGISSDGNVEILSGLRKGDVITRGANFLLDSESRMQFSYDQKNN